MHQRGLTASQSSYKWAMLKINKVDARNPFISWHFVKHRLQDQDMAFAATTLRSITSANSNNDRSQRSEERRLASRRSGCIDNASPIPSTFAAPTRSIRFDGLTPEADGVENRASPGPVGDAGATSTANISRLQEPSRPAPRRPGNSPEALWSRSTLLALLRVLRACKIDRQRMDLWKLWLWRSVARYTHGDGTTRGPSCARSPVTQLGARRRSSLPAGALSPPWTHRT